MARFMLAAVAFMPAAISFMLAPPAQAAEITAIITNALKSTLTELTPAFEKSSEHKLNATYGSTEPLKARVEKGDPIDVAVIGADAIDQLLKQNKLVASSRVIVVRSGLGIAIRKGAPRPDISTTEAFKRTLLAAKSISFNERGLTGIYLWNLFTRLEITDAIRAKYKDGSGAELVGKGESEIGLTQASEVALAAGVELGGLLPPEIQNYTVFVGAIVANAKQPAAGKALLDFLAAPDTIKVMKAKGLDRAS
jgi:molybdate transport system substrate-binding protein